MDDKTMLEQCNCSFRVRMVGDGCAVCNPEFWRDFYERQEADTAAENASEIGKGMGVGE